MAYDDYLKAQKLALKTYKKNTSKGQYPYLPVLDEILSHSSIEREEKLGIIDIPLKQVVGTSTAGRTRAFSSNFMPLLEFGSEFSYKWSLLIDAQIEEGIRDPIKVYEYMNKYYVVEGNKRTSVLKYLDSPTITAEVTRKVPTYSEDEETQIYYEFMEFYEKTKISYVIFTKTGSYQRLCEAVGKATDEEWSDDDCMYFSSFRVAFYNAYKANKGLEIDSISTDDALLFYLSLYPYEEAKESTSAEIKENLEKIWTEIKSLGEEEPVAIVTAPTTETSMITKMKFHKVHKVAFVYDVTPEESDWAYGHELGREHINERFENAVETKRFLATPNVDDEELLTKLCEEGYDIIFTISAMFIRSCIKVAAQYPSVKIMNCSLNSPHNSVRSYGVRSYEGKFLSGILAATLSKENDLGYNCNYPIYGEIASINAFALGAKMINPNAKVHLIWTTKFTDDSDKYYLEKGIKYISSLNVSSPNKISNTFGLYYLDEEGTKNIATPMYHWGAFYEELINSVIRGSWKKEDHKNEKALNYWWGFSANAMDFICGSQVPDDSKKLIDLLKQSMARGNFQPFSGPLYDQEHNLRCEDNHCLSPDDIMMMDWLVDNVIGEIPTMEQLDDSAKALVSLRGLEQITEKGESSLL